MVELDHERFRDPRLSDQLQAPFQRRQQLDLVPERDARVRLEGDGRREEARGLGGGEHGPVAEVDAVEGPDRDGTRPPLQLARAVCDLHPPILASASSGGTSRSGSASLTSNGPTSVRRSIDAVPAQLVGNRAHVRAGADAQVEPGDAALVRDDLELVDPRAANRHLDLLTAAVQPVGALSADLHRRGRRDAQLDLAAQSRDAPLELLVVRRIQALDDLALPVAGVRARGQIDVRQVALVQPDEARGELRRRSGQNQQQPRRERVERPRMAGARAGSPPHLGHDRERRRALRLVDQEQPARAKCPGRHERTRRG